MGTSTADGKKKEKATTVHTALPHWRCLPVRIAVAYLPLDWSSTYTKLLTYVLYWPFVEASLFVAFPYV